VLAYAVPPIVALFVLGLFWKRANATGAKIGLTLGTMCGIYLFITIAMEKSVNMHFLIAAVVIFVVALVATVLGSLLAPAPELAQIETLMWRKADYDAETEHLRSRPLWQNYRIQAALLIGVTALLVWIWR
jgi:SSS family solute:Na+ symporter